MDASRALARAWPGVVGPELARRARLVGVRDGTVVVACADPAWAAELRWSQRDLLAAVNRVLGPSAVHAVEVRIDRDGTTSV